MQKSIAVVGCGYWGKNLVRNFFELGALACISEQDLKVASELSARYGVENLNFNEILEKKDIDAVVLAVPADLHHSMSIEAMKMGKHVYVEKPLAMNRKEAEEMISVSNKSGVHLMVGHLLQYHPVFRELKRLTNSGELGSLKYIYSNRLSFGKFRSHEDVIWSFAPHDISMILSLTQKNPIRVQTESLPILQDNIADIATIHLDFEDNLKSRISVSWLHPFKEHKLIVIGTKGMATFDDTKDWEKKLLVNEYNVDLNPEKLSGQKSKGKFMKVDYAEPLKEECKYFIDLIDNKVMPLTDGAEGLKVLSVLTETG